MSTQSKGRRIAAWILTTLIALVFVASSIPKLIGAQQAVETVEKWGLRDHLMLIGIGELVSAVLFFIPLTSSLGLLLLSAYLGGAIATHMQNGEPHIIPAVLLVVVWVAGYLRNPEVFESFRSGKR
jgi:uncharacterized membrane protein YphA (DoxX/SURF4 family)